MNRLKTMTSISTNVMTNTVPMTAATTIFSGDNVMTISTPTMQAPTLSEEYMPAPALTSMPSQAPMPVHMPAPSQAPMPVQTPSPTTEMILVPGLLQTKDWRMAQSWYIDGRHNECEILQRKQVEFVMDVPCAKTNLRFNTETFALQTMTRPLDHENGFEWTEDFDGLSIIGNKKFYFNFKFICDAGGAQTRSLREVNHFMKCQLEYLHKDVLVEQILAEKALAEQALVLEEKDTPEKSDEVYFVNILDGNTVMKHLSKFKFLVGKEKYTEVSDRVFIGDMYTFRTWYQTVMGISPAL